MHIYLPIAELSLNVFVLLGIGGVVGILSGMFGVGGGFLITPLLIVIGVPSPVAVATGATQVVAASVSGALAHWQRGNVDVKMGVVLLVGGILGSWEGVELFTILRRLGQIDLVISLCYVVFLGIIGSLMVAESVKAWLRNRGNAAAPQRRHRHTWIHGMPFKTRFRVSKLYISVLPPLAVGMFVGLLSAVMGVGGGFIMVPAMIYVLGMPTAVVIGTSLFQIVFVTGNVTFLQAVNNQTVDVVLALMLVIGSVVGAQIGARFGAKLRGEQLRIALGLIVIAVAMRVAFGLVAAPDDIYSLGQIASH